MTTPAAPGRRVVVDALGPSPLDALERHLHLEDDPAPAPTSGDLAPGDVVIEVRSAAVGWVDLLMLSGQYQHVPAPPYTPGLEFAGTIVGRGDAVTNVQLGDAVIADGLYTGPRSKGDHRRWGGFARYAVAPANAVIPLPPGFSFDEGACLLGGTETAFHALVQRGKVQPGDNVLVLGATGSTGLAAVAMAKLLGATVIAVGRTPDKLATAGRCGADHLVVLRDDDTARLKDEVKRLTGGHGADVIYDPVGGPRSVEALRAAAFGARFLVVGWAATPLVARGGRDANMLPTNLVLMKGIDVLGSPAVIAVHREPALRDARLARILAWARKGELRPVIGASFPLADVAQALRVKWDGGHAGNIVVHP